MSTLIPMEQTRGSAKNSPEYRTIKSLTCELLVALKGDLTHLSSALLSTDPMVLTEDAAEEVRNSFKIEAERAAMLVGYIRNRVCADQKCYRAFVEVLQKKPTYYGEILKQLEKKMMEVLKGTEVMERTEVLEGKVVLKETEAMEGTDVTGTEQDGDIGGETKVLEETDVPEMLEKIQRGLRP